MLQEPARAQDKGGARTRWRARSAGLGLGANPRWQRGLAEADHRQHCATGGGAPARPPVPM
jgi:hypothetical protein